MKATPGTDAQKPKELGLKDVLDAWNLTDRSLNSIAQQVLSVTGFDLSKAAAIQAARDTITDLLQAAVNIDANAALQRANARENAERGLKDQMARKHALKDAAAKAELKMSPPVEPGSKNADGEVVLARIDAAIEDDATA